MNNAASLGFTLRRTILTMLLVFLPAKTSLAHWDDRGWLGKMDSAHCSLGTDFGMELSRDHEYSHELDTLAFSFISIHDRSAVRPEIVDAAAYGALPRLRIDLDEIAVSSSVAKGDTLDEALSPFVSVRVGGIAMAQLSSSRNSSFYATTKDTASLLQQIRDGKRLEIAVTSGNQTRSLALPSGRESGVSRAIAMFDACHRFSS